MTTMKKRTRAEAKKLMWEYYRANKAALPVWIRECREEIILGLQSGRKCEEVFSTANQCTDIFPTPC